MTLVDQTLAAEYKAIHANKTYGVSGNTFQLAIQTLIVELRPQSILDYGCGQTTLDEQLNLMGATYYRYDPGIPDISQLTMNKADFLINTDVLEHIPETQLDEVLSHIASLSKHVFLNIATRPAKEILPNGQNAHCTIKTADQWRERLRPYFPEIEAVVVRPGHSVLFLTWDSPVKDVVKALVELPVLKKRLVKAEKTISDRIKAEFHRFKRKWSKE